MKKWIFNPFQYIAGGKALLIGLTTMLVTAIISYFGHTHFDGVLDMHYTNKELPFVTYIAEPLIDWISITVILFITGKLLTKSSIRLIDVGGTLALARWPLLFAALIGLIPTNIPASNDIVQMVNHTPPDQILNTIWPVIVKGLAALPFVIWMIALLYNAFTVSCNLKGAKAVIGFIIGLFVAEALSKLMLHQLMHLI